jgi:hypothetical protein
MASSEAVSKPKKSTQSAPGPKEVGKAGGRGNLQDPRAGSSDPGQPGADQTRIQAGGDPRKSIRTVQPAIHGAGNPS